eukprot:10450260-Lingulodinium_polyedra.AAC.1
MSPSDWSLDCSLSPSGLVLAPAVWLSCPAPSRRRLLSDGLGSGRLAVAAVESFRLKDAVVAAYTEHLRT